MRKPNSPMLGFSLVELSITITIIALLVSAMVGGYHLKHQLALKQIIDDVRYLQNAFSKYKLNFDNNLPGDSWNASQIFNNSTISNGNGDTVIDRSESRLFWQHLTIAKLINKYDITSNSELYKSIYDGAFYSIGLYDKNFITLGYGKELLDILSPKDAHYLDSNFDDGIPNTGFIQASPAESSNNHCYDDSFNYLLHIPKRPTCLIHFKLQ